MKKLIICMSLLVGFLITYFIEKEFKYLVGQLKLFVIIVILISIMVIFIISLILLFKRRFKIKRILSVYFRKCLNYICIIAIIISIPSLTLPTMYHVFGVPLLHEDINNIPSKVDMEISEIKDDNIVINVEGLNVFLPVKKIKSIEEPLPNSTIVKLSDDNNNSFWIRNDTEYDMKSVYQKIVNETQEDVSEQYKNLINKSSEYEILHKIYSTTPKDIRLGMRIKEFWFTTELLINKNNRCQTFLPNYYFELQDKSGFLYWGMKDTGNRADLYIKDNIYFIAFGSDLSFKQISYILSNIQLEN